MWHETWPLEDVSSEKWDVRWQCPVDWVSVRPLHLCQGPQESLAPRIMMVTLVQVLLRLTRPCEMRNRRTEWAAIIRGQCEAVSRHCSYDHRQCQLLCPGLMVLHHTCYPWHLSLSDKTETRGSILLLWIFSIFVWGVDHEVPSLTRITDSRLRWLQSARARYTRSDYVHLEMRLKLETSELSLFLAVTVARDKLEELSLWDLVMVHEEDRGRHQGVTKEEILQSLALAFYTWTSRKRSSWESETLHVISQIYVDGQIAICEAVPPGRGCWTGECVMDSDPLLISKDSAVPWIKKASLSLWGSESA